MVIKNITQVIIVFSFFNIGCESQKNIYCDDIKTQNIYSVIDTTKIYSAVYIQDSVEIKSTKYLQFKNNGKIVYFSKTNYNDSIVPANPKYLKGEYYIKNNNIVFDNYFKHPQGGGWLKSILKYKKNDILYIRNNKSCGLYYFLREIELEDKNLIRSL